MNGLAVSDPRHLDPSQGAAPVIMAAPQANGMTAPNPYTPPPRKMQNGLLGSTLDAFQRGFDPQGRQARIDAAKAEGVEKAKRVLALAQQQRSLPVEQRTQWWQQNAPMIAQLTGVDTSQPVDPSQFSDQAMDGHIAALSAQLGMGPDAPKLQFLQGPNGQVSLGTITKGKATVEQLQAPTPDPVKPAPPQDLPDGMMYDANGKPVEVPGYRDLYAALHPRDSEPAMTASPDAVEMLAQAYAAGDSSALSNLGTGASSFPLKQAVLTRAGEILKGQDGGLATNRMGLGADRAALNTLRKVSSLAEARIGAFHKGLEIADSYLDKIGDRGWPLVRGASLEAMLQTGDVNVMGLAQAMNTIQTEYASIMSGSTSGQAHVNDMEHARKILSMAATPEQFREQTKVLEQEADARRSSYKAEMDALLKRGPQAEEPVQQEQAPSPGWTWSQRSASPPAAPATGGQGGKVTINGITFPSQAAADAALREFHGAQ